MTNFIEQFINQDSENLINHNCKTIPSSYLTLPSSQVIDNIFLNSNRSNRVLSSLYKLYHTGRLSGTGYLSILPVDQGVEHSAGASFAHNIQYFDPINIVELAIEGGCNAVASTLGTLGICSRKYAHKIPFIVKLNHNELLSYPNSYDQIYFAQVKQAFDMGATGIGATIYFGSKESKRQIEETTKAFAQAHEYGLCTILWCYLRNEKFYSKDKNQDFHQSADLTGQANYLGVTIEADLIKQKLPTNNEGYLHIPKLGKTDQKIYKELTTMHPIDLARYQVANCYMGRIGLINSGGPSTNNYCNDFLSAIRTALINKRAGGTGLILGRKAFQKSRKDGIKILNLIQDIYLNQKITIA